MKKILLFSFVLFSLQSFAQKSPTFKKRIVSGTVFLSDTVLVDGERIYSTLLIPEKDMKYKMYGLDSDPYIQEKFLIQMTGLLVKENNEVIKDSASFKTKHTPYKPVYNKKYYSEWKDGKFYISTKK